MTQELTPSKISPLDPTKNLGAPVLESSVHAPLPEEYIWTANDANANDKVLYTRPAMNERIEPHYFRRSFTLAAVPRQATLYIAGPRSVDVWLNGILAEHVESDVTSPLGMHVFATNVAKYLQPGVNTIAIEVVRGRGVTGFANSALVRQQTFGQVLVVKLLPQPEWVDGPALLISDKQWKSASAAPEGWQTGGVRRCEVGAGAEHWGHRELGGAVSVERGCGAVRLAGVRRHLRVSGTHADSGYRNSGALCGAGELRQYCEPDGRRG